jgi:hypothetical protein
VDLREAALDSELEAPTSEVRPLVPTQSIPWMLMTYDQVRTLPLDPRAAFLLSLVDGRCTVELIVEMSGFEREEALGIVGRLLHLGVIELHDP